MNLYLARLGRLGQGCGGRQERRPPRRPASGGDRRRRCAGFAYDLSLVAPDRVNPADLVVETPHGVVYVAAADAERLRGATIGLDPIVSGGAIAIDNPNVGWTDPLALRQAVLDTQVNPGVAADSGYTDLLEVRDGTAYLSMGGGCVDAAAQLVRSRQETDFGPLSVASLIHSAGWHALDRIAGRSAPGARPGLAQDCY